jgi:alpha-N-arabinofuranosidase
VISAGTKGTVNFNLVSLFPPVFKERTGTALGGRPTTGFRPDIMKLLDDMHPAFLRFPGGNYLEGSDFANRFDFKTTIGPWEQRPGHQVRGAPILGRHGALEFLEWCEELNMEPLLGVYAGLNLDGGRDLKTGEALKPLIQDALDEIEYILGDVTTTWGARRAKDGHPAPFKLTYVEIGNEDFLNNGTRSYQGRKAVCHVLKAIRAKYPTQVVIRSIGRRCGADVIDNHHYMSPNAAIRNAHLYDKVAVRSRDFRRQWASQERRNEADSLLPVPYRTPRFLPARAERRHRYHDLLCPVVDPHESRRQSVEHRPYRL